MLDKQTKNLLEVITTLKTLILHYGKEATPRMPLRRIRWALCCAVECVEKQVAKKVIGIEANLLNRYCPSCNEWSGFELKKNMKYCPNCGQKLDWSE